MSDLTSRPVCRTAARWAWCLPVILLLAGCGRSPDQRDKAILQKLDSLELQLDQLERTTVEHRNGIKQARGTISALRREAGYPPAPEKPLPAAPSVKAVPAPAATVPPVAVENPARTAAASRFLRTFGILCFTAFLVVQFTKAWRRRNQGPGGPEKEAPGPGRGSTVYVPPSGGVGATSPEESSAGSAADGVIVESVAEPEAPARTPVAPVLEPERPAGAEPAAEAVRGVYDAPAGKEEPPADESRWTVYQPGTPSMNAPVVVLPEANVDSRISPSSGPAPDEAPSEAPEPSAGQAEDQDAGSVGAGEESASTTAAEDAPASTPAPTPAPQSQAGRPQGSLPAQGQAHRKGKHGRRHR